MKLLVQDSLNRMVDFKRNLQNVHSATFSSILNLLIIPFDDVRILTEEEEGERTVLALRIPVLP